MCNVQCALCSSYTADCNLWRRAAAPALQHRGRSEGRRSAQRAVRASLMDIDQACRPVSHLHSPDGRTVGRTDGRTDGRSAGQPDSVVPILRPLLHPPPPAAAAAPAPTGRVDTRVRPSRLTVTAAATAAGGGHYSCCGQVWGRGGAGHRSATQYITRKWRLGILRNANGISDYDVGPGFYVRICWRVQKQMSRERAILLDHGNLPSCFVNVSQFIAQPGR